MKLSTRTRYGTRAMAELGIAYPAESVSARQMAENQQLSLKYLEHIMAALKAADLVTPVRGMRGGYKLAKAPADISIGDVYRALEGSPSLVECVEDADTCRLATDCTTRDTWVDLTSALRNVLDNTTVQDLVDRRARTNGLGARGRRPGPTATCVVTDPPGPRTSGETPQMERGRKDA